MKDLFRFPAASHRDPAVAAWLVAQPGERGAIARRWFEQLRRCGPDVRELVHDGCPVACVDDVAFAYVNVFTSHVNIGFFHGAALDDPADLLEGTGKRMRHLTLRPDADADNAAISRLVEDAYVDVRRRIGEDARDT
jgi:hypothetical protein